jgi:hypothetical protein
MDKSVVAALHTPARHCDIAASRLFFRPILSGFPMFSGSCKKGSRPMKKILIVAAGSIFLVGAAAAADLPRAEPVYQQATVGKMPIGKTPIGKTPVGKTPVGTPLTTRG